MRGASVAANSVNANIGGNLTIESLKDQSTFDSVQTSVGGGLSFCFPPICYGTMVVANVSASRTKVNATQDSVGAQDDAAQRGQSGIRAGDGGFNITVGGNTSLIGGAMTSSDKAVTSKANSFTTAGSLTLTDLDNKSALDASSISISLRSSSGSSSGAAGRNSGSMGIGTVSDSRSSTTRSAISGVAGDQAARTGDAQAGIAPVFNPKDVGKVTDNLGCRRGLRDRPVAVAQP